MSEKQIRSVPTDQPHRRAEEIVQADEAKTRESLSSEATQRVLHELRVHQVELEMQNEELCRTRAELEGSRAQYFELFDLAPVGYLTLDQQGLILEANLTFARLLGVARGDLVKRPLNRFILDEDRKSYDRFRKQFAQPHAAQVSELRMRRAGAAPFWARIESIAVRPHGDVLVCRAVVSDITEAKLIEEARGFLLRCGYQRPGEDFFRELARYLARSLAMDYVCIDRLEGDGLAAQTVAVYSDGQFEDNVRYALKDTPCGEVATNSVCCFPRGVRRLFPRDAVLQQMKAESYLGVTLTGEAGRPIGLIAVIGRKPLESPPLAEALLRFVALRAAGELERRRASEELQFAAEQRRLALEVGRLGTWDYDFEKGRVFWDETCRSLFGVPSGEALDYSKVIEIMHPEDQKRVKQAVETALQPKSGGHYQADYRVVHPDGTVRWLAAIGQAYFQGDGEGRRAVRFIGTVQDITERRQIQEALQRAHDELGIRVEQRTRSLRGTVSALEKEVTTRVRAEKELRESEERYRTLFNSASVGIAVTDSAGRVEDANPALCEMLGVSLAEGRSLRAGFFYAKAAERRRLLARVKRDGRIDDFEVRLRRKDGSEFPASLRMSWMWSRKGKTLLTILTDVTRRKQAEDHVQGVAGLQELFLTRTVESDYLDSVVQLLRHWCECRSVGIRLLDSQGRLQFTASAGFTRGFRKEADQSCQKNGLCPYLRAPSRVSASPDSRSLLLKGFSVRNDFGEFAGESAVTGKQYAALPCAKAGCASAALAPIRHRGRLLGAILAADRKPQRFSRETLKFLEAAAALVGEALHRFRIEARLRESELRFRALFEGHQTVMLLVDPHSGAIVDANRAAQQFYGYRRSRLSALSVRDLSVLPPQLPGGRPPRGARKLGGSQIFPHRLASGEIRLVEIHSSPIAVRERTLLFSIIHDITERRRLERQVLEIGDLERQRIGRDLHDSLGGSLSGLAMLGKALSRTVASTSPQQAEMAEELVRGISETVRRTRSIARGLCPVGLSTFGFVNAVEELARSIQQQHRIRCQVRVPQRVAIDEENVTSNLFQIVQEAVHNAAQHSKARRIEIVVSQSRSRLSLKVCDDGVGLPKDLTRSTGMGLRTMRYRADVVGATLELLPARPRGTIVSCILPLTRKPNRSVAQAAQLAK